MTYNVLMGTLNPSFTLISTFVLLFDDTVFKMGERGTESFRIVSMTGLMHPALLNFAKRT